MTTGSLKTLFLCEYKYTVSGHVIWFSNFIYRMVVANQVKRRTALALGNIVTNKSSAKNKTVTDIKTAWENGDTTLSNQVRYFGKSLDGSPQYFYSTSIQALVSITSKYFKMSFNILIFASIVFFRAS